jgi:hypothetical protein
LKIVIKTKDETAMLRRWIGHHLPIVGESNIILFDNMSTDPETADIYLQFRSLILTARFAGYQDTIHSPLDFPELFQALRESCEYYIFLDTDEFLYWFLESNGFVSDGRIVDLITAEPRCVAFPGTWLANVPYYHDRFYWSDGYQSIDPSWVWGLKWGKPIVSSRVDIKGVCRHNSELDSGLYSGATRTNLFVAHLNSLSPKQRIAADLRKLRALKLIGSDDDVGSVLRIDPGQITNELIRGYCLEIRKMLDMEETHPQESEDLQAATIKLNRDGTIGFFECGQRELLERYLTDPSRYISTAL